MDANIDAFALNMPYALDYGSILPTIFEIAATSGLALFFSFDYAGNGAWPKEDVADLLATYTPVQPYLTYNNQYLVSTFEGPASAADWTSLKTQFDILFIPDWSSLGAKAALEQADGVADGLFNWAAWPWGAQDMDTYTDAAYFQYLNESGASKPYIMPASPWFFTNLPGYDKNWLWRGDDLWYDRWVQIIYNQPDFVEIISWNDYGESHYIGPLYDDAMEAFTIGEAPSNYATDMPHDGWRLFLPYVISLYKFGTATITNEGLTTWYRLSTATACDGGTTGNTASELQIEFPPSEILQDKIFFSALLGSAADVTVSIGGVSQAGLWTYQPDDGVGIYHGSVTFTGTGDVVVLLSRDGATVAEITGKSISSGCTDGLFNAWVGGATSTDTISATPTLKTTDQVCVNGTGANNFVDICAFGCEYGYCPVTACVCKHMGQQITEPDAVDVLGYPIDGEDASYSGICSYDCAHGYCPDTACGTSEYPLTVPTVSDFSPPACVSGTGDGALEGLCSYACNYGFCPMHACTCTGQGALIDSPAIDAGVTGSAVDGITDYGLCAFACERGYCPDGVCMSSGNASTGEVYVPPSVWGGSNPEVQCIPPCTIILPPFPLGSTTTITFPSMVTSVWTSSSGSTGTKTTLVPVPPLTIDGIPWWPVNIPTTATDPFSFYPLQSFMPPATTISLGPDEVPFSPVPSGSATPAPVFPGTSSVVTVQPQATSSVSIDASVPSVTFSSATPTATCTTGCGTDGCSLFGGCDSADPADDCGTDGCGGGCSIQGCDQTSTCGTSCSTDQMGGGSSSSDDETSDDTDPSSTTLPVDYDGPDGSSSGDWNPNSIGAALASSATSVMSAQITTAIDMINSMTADWDNDDLKTAVSATVTAAMDAIATAAADVTNAIQVANPSGDVSFAVSWFADLFGEVSEDMQSAVQWATSLPDPSEGAANAEEATIFIEQAQSLIDDATEEVQIEVGEDICDTNFETAFDLKRKRATAAAPPSCSPKFQVDPGDPSNSADIPDFVGCDSKAGFNDYSNSEILAAIKQAIKYNMSPNNGVAKAGVPDWQTATKGAYPHKYANSVVDSVSWTEECNNADPAVFSLTIEFPILKAGNVLEAGKNSNVDVGTDRVVYRTALGSKPGESTWSWIYCGLMTHYTAVKVPGVINNQSKMLLPFQSCTASCSTENLEACAWLFA